MRMSSYTEDIQWQASRSLRKRWLVRARAHGRRCSVRRCRLKAGEGHDRHLAVAAACCAALDAKCGALAGLADACDHLAAQIGAHRLAHAHSGRGLALAQRSGCNPCHHHCKEAHSASERMHTAPRDGPDGSGRACHLAGGCLAPYLGASGPAGIRCCGQLHLRCRCDHIGRQAGTGMCAEHRAW